MIFAHFVGVIKIVKELVGLEIIPMGWGFTPSSPPDPIPNIVHCPSTFAAVIF